MTFVSIFENISSTHRIAHPLETFPSLPELHGDDASEPMYTRSEVSGEVAGSLGALSPG